MPPHGSPLTARIESKVLQVHAGFSIHHHLHEMHHTSIQRAYNTQGEAPEEKPVRRWMNTSSVLRVNELACGVLLDEWITHTYGMKLNSWRWIKASLLFPSHEKFHSCHSFLWHGGKKSGRPPSMLLKGEIIIKGGGVIIIIISSLPMCLEWFCEWICIQFFVLNLS